MMIFLHILLKDAIGDYLEVTLDVLVTSLTFPVIKIIAPQCIGHLPVGGA
jgi:hypothetical protein